MMEATENSSRPGKTTSGPAAQATAPAKPWCVTTRQRTDPAAAQGTRRHTHAARTYTVAAVTAYRAAITATTAPPLGSAEPADTDDDPAAQRLMSPPETGVHAIDSEVGALYGDVTGKPWHRHGPAPKPRTRESSPPIPRSTDTGHNLAALARRLHGHIDRGTLLRLLLHPAHVSAGHR